MSLSNEPMIAELAGKLLVDAADFFVALGEQNAGLNAQMTENADVFRQMSALLLEEPTGSLNGNDHGELAGRLLCDAATFFRSLAEQNEPLREQMNENADVYQQLGELVKTDPLGTLEGQRPMDVIGAFNRAKR